MGIFDRFKQSNDGPSMNSDILSAILNDGSTLTREEILSIPEVAADLDIISSTFATIPFNLYKKIEDEDGRKRVINLNDDERVFLINEDTRDQVDPYMLKKALCEDFFMGRYGGGYAYLERSGMTIKAIRYVKDESVGIEQYGIDPIHKDYKINVGGESYDTFNFLKFLRNSRNGVTGESIVSEVNTALQISFQALKYQYAILKKGGSKKGFLQTSHTVEGKALDDLRENWRRLYSNDNERAILLNAGLEFKETSSSTAEMQLDETKQTLNKEIDAIFHIYEDQEKLIKRAILPLGTAFENALNSVTLKATEKEDHFWKADYSELLRASMKERFEAYRQAKESGWMTINEIRNMENLEAIEGMDTLNVGLNAALYSIDGELDRERFYVPNTDTAERKQMESESEKGENQDE